MTGLPMGGSDMSMAGWKKIRMAVDIPFLLIGALLTFYIGIAAFGFLKNSSEHYSNFILGTCMMNGEHRRELIALVDVADAEMQTRIVRAWRMILERETIEPIPVEGVTCYIDGWDT